MSAFIPRKSFDSSRPTHQFITAYKWSFGPGELKTLEMVEKLVPLQPHDYEWAEDWWSEPPKWQKPFFRCRIPLGALVTTNPQFLKL